MVNLTLQQIIQKKIEFEKLASDYGVVVLYGTLETKGENKLDTLVTVELEQHFDWRELLEKIGKLNTPFVVLETGEFDENDYGVVLEKEEITKERFGENYNDVMKKNQDFKSKLKNVKVGDLTSLTCTAIMGNYLIQQTYFSELAEIKFVDWDEFEVEDEEEELEDKLKLPSKEEIKQIQEKLKPILTDDPFLLSCTNKSLRHAFLKDKIDELEISEYAKHIVLRDSIHLVEFAFVQAKNKN